MCMIVGGLKQPTPTRNTFFFTADMSGVKLNSVQQLCRVISVCLIDKN